MTIALLSNSEELHSWRSGSESPTVRKVRLGRASPTGTAHPYGGRGSGPRVNREGRAASCQKKTSLTSSPPTTPHISSSRSPPNRPNPPTRGEQSTGTKRHNSPTHQSFRQPHKARQQQHTPPSKCTLFSKHTPPNVTHSPITHSAHITTSPSTESHPLAFAGLKNSNRLSLQSAPTRHTSATPRRWGRYTSCHSTNQAIAPAGHHFPLYQTASFPTHRHPIQKVTQHHRHNRPQPHQPGEIQYHQRLATSKAHLAHPFSTVFSTTPSSPTVPTQDTSPKQQGVQNHTPDPIYHSKGRGPPSPTTHPPATRSTCPRTPANTRTALHHIAEDTKFPNHRRPEPKHTNNKPNKSQTHLSPQKARRLPRDSDPSISTLSSPFLSRGFHPSQSALVSTHPLHFWSHSTESRHHTMGQGNLRTAHQTPHQTFKIFNTRERGQQHITGRDKQATEQDTQPTKDQHHSSQQASEHTHRQGQTEFHRVHDPHLR